MDAHSSAFKNYALSLQTPAQMFSSSISNPGFAAGHLQQALLEQRGGYMAMAPATPQPQDHIPLFGSPDPEVSKTQHGSIGRVFSQKLINPSNI